MTEPIPETAPKDSISCWHSVLPWLCLALLCAVLAPTVQWLWYRWTLGIYQNGHALLMPVIVVYLVWEKLRDDPVRQERSSPWGFAFVVPGLVVLALDSAIGTQLLSAIALVLMLPGLSLLLLGARYTRRLAFPLVIAWFMLPIPAGFVAPVHLVLREVSAWGTAQLLPLFGIPVFADHTLLTMPTARLMVADACSGFSTLYAALTTALILGHWSHSLKRAAIFILTAIVLTLICNTIRVTALAVLIHHTGIDILKTSLHQISGMISFAFVLVLLFVLAGRKTFAERR